MSTSLGGTAVELCKLSTRAGLAAAAPRCWTLVAPAPAMLFAAHLFSTDLRIDALGPYKQHARPVTLITTFRRKGGLFQPEGVTLSRAQPL